MNISIIKSVLGAWVMTIVYHHVMVTTGVQLKLLLCAAIALMMYGLCTGFRKCETMTKEEA